MPARHRLGAGGEDKQLSLFDGATIDPRSNPSDREIEIAQNRENLIKIYSNSLNGQKRADTMTTLLERYNRGDFPEIFQVLGPVSRSTLYGWSRDYREGGFDALIPLYKCRRPKVSRAEDRCLRELLLDHTCLCEARRQVSIGQAIFITKYFLKRKGRESPSSPATLRRWAKRILEKK